MKRSRICWTVGACVCVCMRKYRRSQHSLHEIVRCARFVFLSLSETCMFPAKPNKKLEVRQGPDGNFVQDLYQVCVLCMLCTSVYCVDCRHDSCSILHVWLWSFKGIPHTHEIWGTHRYTQDDARELSENFTKWTFTFTTHATYQALLHQTCTDTRQNHHSHTHTHTHTHGILQGHRLCIYMYIYTHTYTYTHTHTHTLTTGQGSHFRGRDQALERCKRESHDFQQQCQRAFQPLASCLDSQRQVSVPYIHVCACVSTSG